MKPRKGGFTILLLVCLFSKQTEARYLHFLIADKTYSKSELLDIATEHPERFSPKVLLRPVFQDALLPTAAYVAGPGETGYLAQTKELFEHFDVQMPAIVPRHSFTLIDKKSISIRSLSN